VNRSRVVCGGLVVADECLPVGSTRASTKGFLVNEGPDQVNGWSYEGGVTLESYRYAPGPASEGMKHSHEEYQFCLSLDFPGEYRYRGGRHDVPIGSIGAIHPGEVHSTQDPFDREVPATFRLMYANSTLLTRAVEEVAGRNKGLPFFSNPILLDGNLFGDFLGLHVALEEGTSSRLESDVRLLSVLTKLVARRRRIHPQERGERAPGREACQRIPRGQLRREHFSGGALAPYQPEPLLSRAGVW
jgi:hypothetical protein